LRETNFFLITQRRKDAKKEKKFQLSLE